MDTTLPAIVGTRHSQVPALLASAGPRASERTIEFFTAHIRNANTREAYGRAVGQFVAWLEGKGARDFAQVNASVVAAWVKAWPIRNRPR